MPRDEVGDMVTGARPLHLARLLRLAMNGNTPDVEEDAATRAPCFARVSTEASANWHGKRCIVRARARGKNASHDWVAVCGAGPDGRKELWFAKLLLLFATRDSNAAPLVARRSWMLLRYLDEVTDGVTRPHAPDARHFQYTRGRLYVEELSALVHRVLLVRSPRMEQGRKVFLLLPNGKAARVMCDVRAVMRA